MTYQQHSSAFSDQAFWSKVKRYARKAGLTVLEPAMQMYYALQDGDTPAWAKATIVGALGYFIFPLDLIPDMLPGVDLGVLVGAMGVVAAHIKAEHKALAADKLRLWFGDRA